MLNNANFVQQTTKPNYIGTHKIFADAMPGNPRHGAGRHIVQGEHRHLGTIRVQVQHHPLLSGEA